MINKSNLKKTHLFESMLIGTTLILTLIPIHSQSMDLPDYNTTFQVISKYTAREITNNFILKHHHAKSVTIDTQNVLLDTEKERIIGYVFDLNPAGYVVVSSSRFLPPIIAYSWKTSFPTDVSDPFVQFITLDLTTQLENTDRFSYSVIEDHINEWDIYSSEQIAQVNVLYEQWPPEGSTSTEGWVETTWTQESPFNDFCPIDPDTGARSAAGCPAVAMAQIFNYHKVINNIKFSDEDDYFHNYLDRYWIDNDYETYDFPSFPELNAYLNAVNQRFIQSEPLSDEEMAALNFACGVACKQVFSPEGSGTFGVDQAYNAYLRFNCSTVHLYDESSEILFTSVIEDIKNARPVHLAVVNPTWTAGHNLIIDGYNTDDFFHLNFGWGGSYDAWYQLPTDLPFDLTVIEGIIVNIMNQNTSEDLSCEGHLQWQEVTPGEEINGSFTVLNTGEPGSLLSWKVLSVPDWGTWTIIPEVGMDLSPEEGSLTVNVTVVAPNKKNEVFSGGITLVNTNNPGDREFIPIALQTAKRPKILLSERPSIQNIPFFSWLILRYST